MSRRWLEWARLGLAVALLGGSLATLGAPPAEAASSGLKLISGERAVLSGELPTWGVRTVKLQAKSGKKWHTVGATKTNEDGEFELTTNRVRKTTSYRAYAPRAVIGGWVRPSITSKTFKVTVVKQSASLTLDGQALVNETATAILKSSPAREGRTLQLQAKQGTRWVVVAEGKADASGRVEVAFTPTATGSISYRTVAKARKGASSKVSSTKKLRVTLGSPRITTATLPSAALGKTYATSLAGSGGATPYTWKATGLPAGLGLDTVTGRIGGTPTVYGNYTAAVTLTDKVGATDTRALALKVTADPLRLTTTSLPTAEFGKPYTATLAGSGGAAPYAWKATGLPAGLSLDRATGRIGGTPTVYGDFAAKVTLTDKVGAAAAGTLGLKVTADAVAIITLGLPNAAYGRPYEAVLSGAGGAAPYSWRVSGLPDGLTLDAGGGRISGTPTESGSFRVDVEVADRLGAEASQTLGLVVTTGAAAVAAGNQHTCAVTDTGSVACWGSNTNGELGDGTGIARSVPVLVKGLEPGVAQVAVGGSHTCALTKSGRVMCWGSNGFGALGDGTTTSRSVATDVSGLSSGVTQIAAGYVHTCALTEGGDVLCWGGNNNGQLGDGTTTPRDAPVPVSGLDEGVTQIVAGMFHTCALTQTGRVMCWGSWGQAFDGTDTWLTTARPVSGLTGVTQVAAGYGHTCALIDTGSVSCWGDNDAGQLGDNTTTHRYQPVQVSRLPSGIRQIAAGAYYTCALAEEGGVVCWGSNTSGQLGDNTAKNQRVPTEVTGLGSGARQIATGYDHACAITDAGSVLCWGSNFRGQLGDGTTTTRIAPVEVIGFARAK